MARARCTECGKRFSASADRCPSCGKSTVKKLSRFRSLLPLMISFVLGAMAALAVAHGLPFPHPRSELFPERIREGNPKASLSRRDGLSFGDILTLAHSESQSVDLAEANILCAEGLPGVGDLDVPKCVEKIDRWTELVRKQTLRRLSEYTRSPQTYDNSEARFRLSVLADVIGKDIGLYYDCVPLLQHPVGTLVPQRGNLFQDPRQVFIHGVLLGEAPPAPLTLTVIVTAIGRRLGYPLKLVTARTHAFVRWEDDKDRINFEITSGGLRVIQDETYREACLKGLSAEAQDQYMRSFSPARELAVFLSRRAACFMAKGQLLDAEVCWAHAWELDPTQQMTLESLRSMVYQERAAIVGSAPHRDARPPPSQASAVREDSSRPSQSSGKGL